MQPCQMIVVSLSKVSEVDRTTTRKRAVSFKASNAVSRLIVRRMLWSLLALRQQYLGNVSVQDADLTECFCL
jgi:hypothetical protein